MKPNFNFIFNLPEAERFKHDCPDCIYVGSTWIRGGGGDPNENFFGADWYSCKNTLDRSGQTFIARWSDRPEENWSWSAEDARKFTADEATRMSRYFQTVHVLARIGA